MKNNIKKAVTAISVTFISIGLICCVISANNGGSFINVLRSNGVNVQLKADEQEYVNPYGAYDPYTPYTPYRNGGSDYYYGGGSSIQDEIDEFFREFGIDMYGGSSGRSSGGNNYPIQ